MRQSREIGPIDLYMILMNGINDLSLHNAFESSETFIQVQKTTISSAFLQP